MTDSESRSVGGIRFPASFDMAGSIILPKHLFFQLAMFDTQQTGGCWGARFRPVFFHPGCSICRCKCLSPGDVLYRYTSPSSISSRFFDKGTKLNCCLGKQPQKPGHEMGANSHLLPLLFTSFWDIPFNPTHPL